MILTHDYSKFDNYQDCTSLEQKAIKYDYIVSLMNTVRMLGCNEWLMGNIADTAFYSMISSKCFYHTPVHIMSMFAFAQQNSISLTPVQELAIFFHDVIYRPGSKINEDLSVKFMQALLTDTGIKEDVIEQAVTTIEWTAKHLMPNSFVIELAEPDDLTVLDLDMAGFAASPKVYKQQNEMIELEFFNPERLGHSDTTEEQFLTGRLSFLTQLKAKDSIYKTAPFLEKFEMRAQTNLSNSIIETRNRFESLKK